MTIQINEDGQPTVCINGGECDECQDRVRCYGEDEENGGAE